MKSDATKETHRTAPTVYGVIGQPIGHSLSPVMHSYFLSYFRLKGVYAAFEVSPDHLQQAVVGLRALGLRGINVTVPHKQAILNHVDVIADDVRLLGAANTISNEDGKLVAYNTDPIGFSNSLDVRKNQFKGAHVVVFGAGGSARSVVYALSQLNVASIVIVNRSLERARVLADLARTAFGLKICHAIATDSSDVQEAIASAQILINCTSLGMSPQTETSPITDFSPITSRHFVYDLVYNPLETTFLQQARQQGAMVQNGLDMLIFQGLASLQIWTGEWLELSADALRQLKLELQTELEHDR